jgi:uncharacterized protein YndB with AHSA1/START domain
MVAGSKGKTTFEVKGDLEIVMTREFNAPRELVFEMWTSPEHIRQWWGPRDTNLTTCEMDFRVGGKWRFVDSAASGETHPFSGEFLEIDPPGRLVFTQCYEPWPDHVLTEIVELSDRGGKTFMVNTSRFKSREDRDRMVESGMEGGATESMERLAELVEKKSK